MKATSFNLTEQHFSWLKSESKRTGMTQAEILRRAIDFYRDALVEKQKKQGFTTEQRNEIKRLILSLLRTMRKA